MLGGLFVERLSFILPNQKKTTQSRKSGRSESQKSHKVVVSKARK